jgi:proton-translocating NADH-quinone oxidoreductase chain N
VNFDPVYMSPELVLAVGAILTLIVGLGVRKWSKPGPIRLLSPEVFCLLALVVALIPTIMLFQMGVTDGVAQFGGMIAVDGLALFFKIIAILSTILVAFLSIDYFKGMRFHRGEFYSLLLFATLAITLLAASTDLIMIYLSLEFLSITSYILAGYLKQDPKSNEAAVKYFLYGSIAAAVMIYGMSMIYGLAGTTDILKIASVLRHGHGESIHHYALLFISVLMVLAGFGFKIAMVPFHQWAPDTYEGAPTPITAFLSVGSKAAGFAVLVRVLATGLTQQVFDWVPLIVVLCGITMTVGNLVAIQQTNIKRMLAYSSIAQAGYLLIGVAAIPYSRFAVPAVLIYLFTYLFMNLGAFAVVTMLSTRLNSDKIEDYAGLNKRSPLSAWAMVFFMLSLAGIPPTAGFLGKFYVFYAAIESESDALRWLAVIAIVNTVISVYYYFNIVRSMFFTEAKRSSPIVPSRPLGFVLGLTFAATLVIFLHPQPFILLATLSAKMLGMQP